MRFVSVLATLGLAISGLVIASVPTSAMAVTPLALCHLPAPRPVLVAGRGATARADAARPAPAAVIRVDQIGYPTSARKLAEIMTTSRRSGFRWELVRRTSCAVVARGVFADDVQSFSTVEPAIDLTSISPLAFAWQEAGNRTGY